MGQLLLFVVVALVVAAIVFGVTVMVSGGDPGLSPVEPDGKSLPLPSDRPLGEEDVFRTRFDIAFRGYRMAQVDQALQRAAYDIGYKGELIGVLEAEVTALREGRTADAEVLRRAREAAVAPPPPEPVVVPEVTPPDDDPAPAKAQLAAQPGVQPPASSVAQSAGQPEAQPAAQPAAQSAGLPVGQPAAQPAAEQAPAAAAEKAPAGGGKPAEGR